MGFPPVLWADLPLLILKIAAAVFVVGFFLFIGAFYVWRRLFLITDPREVECLILACAPRYAYSGAATLFECIRLQTGRKRVPEWLFRAVLEDLVQFKLLHTRLVTYGNGYLTLYRKAYVEEYAS